MKPQTIDRPEQAYFWQRLEQMGQHTALIIGDVEVSYTDLAQQADDFCQAIQRKTPEQVDRPLILLETANELEPIIAYLGALRANWPVILVDDGATERSDQIRATYAPNIIFHRGAKGWQVDIVSTEPIPMDPDLSVLLSTSGTTGAAKLVRLSAQNLEANALSIASYLGVQADDRAITTLPFHYSYGMSVLHIHLLAGAALILTQSSLVEASFWAQANAAKATSLSLVPTQFEILETIGFSKKKLSSLRYITQAGGKLDPLLAHKFATDAQENNWQLFIMYGQTEAGPRMSYVPPQDVLNWSHTIGQPISGGTFQLIDTDGKEITAANQDGELIYEGPNVMQGYALSRADLATPPKPKILHTGDIARRLDNGFYQITGRASRFIKLFGLRIGLDEIETNLRGDGHKVYASGSDAVLVIFTQQAGDIPALHQQVCARYKLPDSAVRIAPLSDVPLLSSGKVDYRTLAKMGEDVAAMQVSSSTDLKSVLQAGLHNTQFDLDRTFLEHGGDSLSYLEVQMYLSDNFETIPENWEALPLKDLIALDSQFKSPPSGRVVISADLIARMLALTAVISLHSTDWRTGGGAYLLLILAGYSLARFQAETLMSGHIFKMMRTMLLPIVICYYILITALHFLWEPIEISWFLLSGNFLEHIKVHGMTPYWFVCTYVQVLILISLPFALPPIRDKIRKAPFVTSIIALVCLIGIVEILAIDQVHFSIRHRHPLVALELLLVGWGIYFANDLRDKFIMAAMIVLLFVLQWLDLRPGVIIMLLLGVAITLFSLQVSIPKPLAKGLMRVGSLTMFIYLVHPIIISLVFRLVDGPDILRFAVVVTISILCASGLKWAYDFVAGKIRISA